MTNEPLKATHTPLPWRFEAGVEDNEGEFYVCHAGTVCTETTVCNPRSEADARLIVHAVNSHHDLIEALRVARKIIADIDDYMKRPSRGDWGEECACCMGELLDDDRQAIAKIDAILTKDGRSMTHVPYPGCYCSDCVEGTPSARITGDKDRENPVEGAPLEAINRRVAIECHRLRTALRWIADTDYVDQQSGNQNFEHLQSIARDTLTKEAGQ